MWQMNSIMYSKEVMRSEDNKTKVITGLRGRSLGKWPLFIIPNRAHQSFSKHAGNPIFSAVVDLVVSNEMSTFEAKSIFGLVNTIDQNWHFSYTLHRLGERVSLHLYVMYGKITSFECFYILNQTWFWLQTWTFHYLPQGHQC